MTHLTLHRSIKAALALSILWALCPTGKLLFVTVQHGSRSSAMVSTTKPLYSRSWSQDDGRGSGSWEIISTQWPNALVNAMPSEPVNLPKVLGLRYFLLAQLNTSLFFTSQP